MFITAVSTMCSSIVLVVTTLWSVEMEIPGSSGCQYSMRLDRLHRAYLSLHPSGGSTSGTKTA